jgi:hypothetical protein
MSKLFCSEWTKTSGESWSTASDAAATADKGQPWARRRGTPLTDCREQHRGGKDGKDDNAVRHASYDDLKRGARQGRTGRLARKAFLLSSRASNGIMTRADQGTIQKVTSDDLQVGLICADRDGNRVRIDRLDRSAGMISYHFLNDELRVQEGVRELLIEEFLAEGWYLA